MIAPASTGRDNNKRKDVTNIDQINRGSREKDTPLYRDIMMVVIKLIDLKIELTPPK